MLKRTLLCTAGIAALSLPTMAQAQTDGASSDNVIIVTATQRASDVQDIPIAVTAVTPVELERQGIQDIRTLGAVSASFNLQSSQTESQGTSIRLRGVGTTGNNIGLESAVGVFIDGVYQSRPGVALGELVDVEQLEVLRGPQGTLFGRNTTAGALVVRNVRPDLNEFGGFVNASYGNYDFVNLQGAVNAPLAMDTLGFRLTGAYRRRDGFMESQANGSESHNRDRWMVRGQLLWEPNPDVSVRIIADYQQTDENCCDSMVLSSGNLFTPAFTAEAFPGGIDRPAQFQSEYPFEGSLEANSTGFVNDVEQWGISGELVWDFGGAELTLIGSYRDFLGESRQDDFNAAQVYSVSGITTPAGTPPTFDDIRTWTAEARLQGTAFDGTLDWLIGAYYAHEEIVEEFNLTLGQDFSRVISQAVFGNPGILGLVSAGGNFIGNGAMNPADFMAIDSTGSFANNRFEQEGESFSIFTHNIINITDTLRLTLGGRYVDDRKDARFDQLAANNPACLAGLNLAGFLGADLAADGVADQTQALFAPFGPVVAGTLSNPAVVNGGAFVNCFPFAAPAAGISFLPAEFDNTFSDDEFIYTAQLAWEPDPDVLLYAGFTHGYKAGGFNLDSTAAAGGNDPRFRSEEIDAYEVGIKSTIFGGRGRANVAFFYSELQDFQVLEFTGTQFQTFNVDDVTSTGIEVEFFAQLSDYISTNVAVTYTDANYGDDCDRGGTIVQAAGLCGSSLTNAPEFVGIAGMTYDGPIVGSSDWTMQANVNLRYESDRRTSTNPQNGTTPFDTQDSNFKVNARLGFTTPDERFSIELWGRNLTNEITRSITFNTPLIGGSRSAFIEEPRTYGVTVRGRF